MIASILIWPALVLAVTGFVFGVGALARVRALERRIGEEGRTTGPGEGGPSPE